MYMYIYMWMNTYTPDPEINHVYRRSKQQPVGLDVPTYLRLTYIVRSYT